MLDPEIAKEVLSDFKAEDRLSILDAVNLGKHPKEELETWGLFCACLAWGGVIAKRNLLIPFYEKLPDTFVDFVSEPSQEALGRIYKKESGSRQLMGLCLAIGDLLDEHGSIGRFMSQSESVGQAIFGLAHLLREKLEQHPPTRKFNLPRADQKPPVTDRDKRRTRALKRYCMYFRWMVRDSEPDYGIWDFFDKQDLFHPIDTHVARILQRWGVLSDSSPNWFNVGKVSDYFGKVEPDDPVRFDYHLVTFGQKFCRKNEPICWKCPVRSHFKCMERSIQNA